MSPSLPNIKTEPHTREAVRLQRSITSADALTRSIDSLAVACGPHSKQFGGGQSIELGICFSSALRVLFFSLN